MRSTIVTLACAALLLACQPGEIEQTETADEPTRAVKDEGLVERSVPIQAVTGVGSKKTSPGAFDFTAEMQGAKPGEVRGFAGSDGTKAYVLKSDGKTTTKQFAEYVFNKQENMNLSPDQIQKAAIALAKQNGVQPDPDAPLSPNQSIVCRLKYFASLVKKTDASRPLVGSAQDGGAAMSPGSKKALGYTPPAQGGLDID